MKRWVNQCHLGDCLETMRLMPDNCVDSIVTDPPYGIRFMGKAWDGADIVAKAKDRANYSTDESPRAGATGGHRSIAAEAGKYDLSPAGMLAFQQFSEEWAREAIRVLKPGGYLLSFASTRTYHRMTCGIESAGFEIRDQIGWMFGSGFPKSHNGEWGGTALKPAWEPIAMARKPLIGTVEANWREHGTGALNIDGCRVEHQNGLLLGGADSGSMQCGEAFDRPWKHDAEAVKAHGIKRLENAEVAANLGRWPANLIHDGSAEVLALFPDCSSGGYPPEGGQRSQVSTYGKPTARGEQVFTSSSGSAARFFYCAKASAEDRNEGLGAFKQVRTGSMQATADGSMLTGSGNERTTTRANHHPTVKPTDLMRYLCRLVTPPGGIVLDPFMGSGSTGRAAVLEGFWYIGCERDAGYIEIARARIDSARRQGHQPSLDLQAA